jgi:protein-S-isoprenylcysteine O-methyltransferase Ste14
MFTTPVDRMVKFVVERPAPSDKVPPTISVVAVRVCDGFVVTVFPEPMVNEAIETEALRTGLFVEAAGTFTVLFANCPG